MFVRCTVKKVNAFNERLAMVITKVVATMWCAYVFGILALVSLPTAIKHTSTLIAWIAQTFLQLVLLSIIMVGQKVADAKHEASLQSQQVLHDHLGTGHSVGDD